jgi:glycosyltransferase involved in cell wall biosynthesis
LSELIKNYGLVILGRLSYPGNTAPSNRVHLYAKSLKNAGGFPFIINLHSTFTDKKKFGFLARNNEIPFYFAQKTPYKIHNIFKRNLLKPAGLYNTLIIINRLRRSNYLKVLFYNTTLSEELLLFPFLKLMGIKIIRECCEAPFYIKQNHKSVRVYNFFLKWKLKMYDNLIVISDNLREFYKDKFPQKFMYQIPIIVDMERFKNRPILNSSGPKLITYIGFMGDNKDGIENLIDAVFLLKKSFTNFLLQLIGTASENELSLLQNKVKLLGLEKNVLFLGKKNTDEIPNFLSHSNILVLARPNNNQAKAGFPTKLGEYLAAGKPVVITKTGEIPKYLQHKVSAYLAEPDDVCDFAEKLLDALTDQNAEGIGHEGLKVAANNFDYKIYSAQLFNLIQN